MATTTIRVRDEDAGRFNKFIGELQSMSGRNVTQSEAFKALLDERERGNPMLKQLRKRELEVIKRQATNSERMTAINVELQRLEPIYPNRADYMENCRHLGQEYDTLKGQNEALQNELLWVTDQITNIEYGLS